MGHIYLLRNDSFREDIYKIGISDHDDVQTRVDQLFSTAVPSPFLITHSVVVQDHSALEKALHQLLDSQRIHAKREFFRLNEKQVQGAIDLMNMMGIPSTPTYETQVASMAVEEQQAQRRVRRPNLNFDEMGIPIGAELRCTIGDVTVTISGPRKVKLNGDEMYLTDATRRALDLEYSVAPSPYWTYNDQLLQSIYERTYPQQTSA